MKKMTKLGITLASVTMLAGVAATVDLPVIGLEQAIVRAEEASEWKYYYALAIYENGELIVASSESGNEQLSMEYFIAKYTPAGASITESNMELFEGYNNEYGVIIKYEIPEDVPPTNPEKPVEPVQPVEPITPPTEPTIPEKPVEPTTPEKPTQPTTPPSVEPEKPAGKTVSLGVAFDDIKLRMNLLDVVLYPGDTYSFDVADFDNILKQSYGMSINDFEVIGGKVTFSYDDVTDGEFYVLDFAKKPTTPPVVEPEKTVQPVAPTTPEKPVEPTTPEQPTHPTTPDKPADKPTETVTPPTSDGETSKPTAPATPPADKGGKKEAATTGQTVTGKPVVAEGDKSPASGKPATNPAVKPAETMASQATTSPQAPSKTLPATGEAASILSLVGVGLMGLVGLATTKKED